MNFEKSIQELEQIVEKLNDKDIAIEESIKLFESGVEIVKANYEMLEKASGKVTALQKELDKYTEIKFDEN